MAQGLSRALTVLLLSTLLVPSTSYSAVYKTPTKALAAADYPRFLDDLNLAQLELALQRQIKRFSSKKLSGQIQLGGKKYLLNRIPVGLKKFVAILGDFKNCARNSALQRCYDDLNASVRAKFDVYIPDLKPGDPRYGEADTTLFTGYATHVLHASRAAATTFPHPIYKSPGSRLRPTREAIDFQGALAGKGLEVFYSDNLFELYLMQVEGSAAVTYVENGVLKKTYLAYDGTNRKPWNFISEYMMSKGWIPNPSIAAQRKFMRLHPELHQEILATCPSYVYMNVASTSPLGCDAVPVTGGRTIAMDNELYAFKGMLAYIESHRAEETGAYDFEEEDRSKVPFIPFSRFVLDQDTGGAINGKGRADIYFGEDTYAQFAASFQRETGKIYFLMLKNGIL